MILFPWWLTLSKFQYIYPSELFEESYHSSTPRVYVILIGCTFFVMIAVFYVYDWMVTMKEKKITMRAAETGELVNNMFPGALRDKVLKAKDEHKGSWNIYNPKNKIKSLASSTQEKSAEGESNSLAELYLGTSINTGIASTGNFDLTQLVNFRLYRGVY